VIVEEAVSVSNEKFLRCSQEADLISLGLLLVLLIIELSGPVELFSWGFWGTSWALKTCSTTKEGVAEAVRLVIGVLEVRVFFPDGDVDDNVVVVIVGIAPWEVDMDVFFEVAVLPGSRTFELIVVRFAEGVEAEGEGDEEEVVEWEVDPYEGRGVEALTGRGAWWEAENEEESPPKELPKAEFEDPAKEPKEEAIFGLLNKEVRKREESNDNVDVSARGVHLFSK
jgi:hypothetical protein